MQAARCTACIFAVRRLEVGRCRPISTRPDAGDGAQPPVAPCAPA